MSFLTHRRYQLAHPDYRYEFTLSELINENKENDTEWYYSIQEQFEQLLELKVGRSEVFYANRDNRSDVYLIKRIK